MIKAYERLHELGFAHSVEVWDKDDLIGGIYGVALGRAFFGESMFYRRPNASKVALVNLIRRLDAKGYELMDCQQQTEHTARFGAQPMQRSEFLDALGEALCHTTERGPWTTD